MMKSVAATLVIALYALILPLHVGAGGDPKYDAPHYDPGSGVTCATCHTPNQTLGSTGYNNLCVSCHTSADSAAGGMAFMPNNQDKFSHNWEGSDTNLSAGALPPKSVIMNADDLRGRTGNALACVRCHDPHRNDLGCAKCHDPNYDAEVAANGAKDFAANFLRTTNDKDQMCMDCHRPRNTQSHLQGSHPVLVNYSAIATTNPASFFYPPKNANGANDTSDLKNYLTKSGKQVVCSTCHGVHYSDSRSSTADGKAAFATLSSSKDVTVLRTDRRSAAAAAGQPDNVNICSNCHAGKANHNAAGQDIQCSDCHGAHVEYDPADPTGSQGINKYLIRRTISYASNAAQQSKIFYRYTAAAKKEFFTADSPTPGVCQGCHVTLTPGIHATAASNSCTQCHNHNSPNGSFSGTCIKCHPLLAGSHSAHVNNLMSLVSAYSAGDPYFATTTSDSSGYRFGCALCHPATNANHGNGTIVLNSANGAVVTTKVNVTCTASYCHSNGKGTYKTSPNWYNPSAYRGNPCAMCHAASPTSGAHTAHTSINGIHSGITGISYGTTPNFGCEKCHANTVFVEDGLTLISGFQYHVNGSADVNFNTDKMISKAQVSPRSFYAYSTVWTRTGGYKVDANSVDVAKSGLDSGSYAKSSGTCSTVSCHNNGITPAWNTTASPKISCADCHTQL